MTPAERARAQLAALARAGALPPGCRRAATLGDPGTLLRDLNGQDILLRVPLLGDDREGRGYLDIALVRDFGTVLYSFSHGEPWDEERVRAEAAVAGLPRDGPFVAYEYPRVGLEVERSAEVWRVRDWLSGEVETIAGTPPEGRAVAPYSLLESLSPTLRRANVEQYNALVEGLDALSLEQASAVVVPPPAGVMVEIKYSKCPQSHVCFELRRQAPHRCVPASVEMLLAFYRYEYSQRDIACALGQEISGVGGVELNSGKEYMVLKALSQLSADALQPRMYARAFWEVITHEIGCDRPLILFSGGHARVVAGYSTTPIGTATCQGLILYDPQGFAVCWEKFNPSCELLLFSAKLRHWSPPGGGTVRACT